jgi:hypothetical protein
MINTFMRMTGVSKAEYRQVAGDGFPQQRMTDISVHKHVLTVLSV